MPMRLNYITYKRIYNECKMHIKLYTSVVKRTQTHVNYYIRSGYIVVLGLVTGMLYGFYGYWSYLLRENYIVGNNNSNHRICYSSIGFVIGNENVKLLLSSLLHFIEYNKKIQ